MAVFTLEQAFRLAMEQIRAGKARQVESLYAQLRESPPPHAEGLILVAVLAHELGHADESVELIQKAQRLKPGLSHFAYQAGVVLAAMGRVDEAINAYRQAGDFLKDDADVRKALGALLHQTGRVEEAIGAYREALAIEPDDAEALSNLGHALKERGSLEESLVVLQRAIAIRPDLAAAYNNLGNTYEQLNRPLDALGAFTRAVQIEPQLPEAHNNLGNALQRAGRFEEAMAEYSRAVELNATYPDALVNLGNAVKDTGQIGRAIELYRRAVALRPDSWPWSNYLLALYYDPALTPEQILAEHKRWAGPVSEAGKPFRRGHANAKEMNRRLRIGYVSGDFRHHVVGYNILPLFENHDHKAFEIFCYSTTARADDLTHRFRSLADHWIEAGNWVDLRLAERIREDGIDLLVDLSLHTASHRLAVFARKPAPIQVTFAGYPGTTGLGEIDYRLTDPYLDPVGSNDGFYSERSYRLGNSFWCYQPLSSEPVVNSLPASTNGYVTFGSLGNFCKVNEGILELWAKVLAGVGGSRLLMMCRPGPQRERTRGFLQSRGVDPQRIEMVDYQARDQYLGTYHRIDIGLETFPYNGHTTSLDSYWMGVPVVTLVGKAAVGRAGFSQLSNLGLGELVAETEEQFIAIASGLAGDGVKLNKLRVSLRGRMEASPLMNARQFAGDIEAAYRDMWARYVRGG